MSSADRYDLNEMISERLGFDFSEKDLSPKLRREIGQVSARLDDYNLLVEDIDALKTRSYMEISFAAILGIIGILTVLYTIGIVLLVAVIPICMLYIRHRRDVRNKEEEATSLWSSLDNRIEQVSKLAFDELSLLHEARIRPTVKHVMVDFAALIQAAKGKGIILSRIECPYCNGVIEIPSTGEFFKCQYCGKTVHATKIFDKLKDVLT
ncbi:MAG: hypothetical protein NWE90_06100 [Candidatus Bathyarchaeota archaeon]|nr:hypothetical protein [Candidatus Bathyarchaeota archaeon]